MNNLMGQFEAHGKNPRIEQLEAELRDAWDVIAEKDAELKALRFKLEQARDEIDALSLDLGLTNDRRIL